MDKGDKNSSFDIDLDSTVNANGQTKDEIEETEKMDIRGTETQETTTQEMNENTNSLNMKEELDADVDDELININASLAKQISDELETIETEKAIKSTKQKKNRRIPLWVKIPGGILIGMLILVCFGLFIRYTEPGNKLAKAMGGKLWEFSTKSFDEVEKVNEEVIVGENTELIEDDIEDTVVPFLGRQEDYAVNILLLGEEAIGSGSARGRTDLIIVATMNTRDKTIKLTSLMRDTLVRIPGYKENKLNTAYELGGIALLYETIEVNFALKLDGCVMVDFDDFEKIINKLGGIEISLTANEAHYLNTTNYISNKAYRNVVEGMQNMNGNQALGYCRIRKRATAEGVNNDYGRTDRQRIVLNAIFEKYKTSSKVDLAAMMFGILPEITTDITSTQFESLLTTFMDIGLTDMEELRIPATGTFTDNIEVRGMDVLIPDYAANVKILHDFIFGEEY